MEKQRTHRAVFLVFVSILAVALAYGAYSLGRAIEQRDALSQALENERNNTVANGGEPVEPPPDEIMENPELVQGPKGDPGPPPTRDVVIEAVRAVMSTMDVSELVSEEQFTIAIATYMSEHREDFVGPKPTPAELRTAILAVYTEFPPPPGPTGPQGEKGDKGDPPTPEELADAVAAFVAEVGLMLCETGFHPEVGTFVLVDSPPRRVMACFADA